MCICIDSLGSDTFIVNLNCLHHLRHPQIIESGAVLLLDECFISICFFSNGRCRVVTTVTGPSNSRLQVSYQKKNIPLGDSLMWMNKCESDKTGSGFIWLIKFYFGRVWSNLLISTRMTGLFLSLLRTFFVIKMSWLFCCYVPFDIKALFNFHPITWLSP